MLVNGGGAVTLQFQRSPFHPLTRTVFVPWNQVIEFISILHIVRLQNKLTMKTNKNLFIFPNELQIVVLPPIQMQLSDDNDHGRPAIK